MGNQFDFLANLPYLIFALLSLAVLALFAWAAVLILTAKEDQNKAQKGRKMLFNAFVGLFIVLLIVLAFFIVKAVLRNGEALQPAVVFSGFPATPAANYPPPATYTKISNYYFTGPFSLKGNSVFPADKYAVYAISCIKESGYDIIYIEKNEAQGDLLKNQNYSCWLEKCGQLKNIYISILWTDPKFYDTVKRSEIASSLKQKLNPACSQTQ